MLHDIDIRTIVLLLALGNFLALGLLLVYRSQQAIPLPYVLARLSQGVGWALFWQMGPALDWLHFFGGNALLNIGFALEAVALLSLQKRNRRIERAYIALVLVLLINLAIDILFQLSNNTINISASLAALTIFAAPACLLLWRQRSTTFARMIGACYALFCISALIRIVFVLQTDNVSVMTTEFAHAFTFLSIFALLVFGNIGYLLMLKEIAVIALSQTSAFNETILLNSPLPMGVYTAKGQCVHVNEAYANLINTPRYVLLAENIFSNAIWKASPLLVDCRQALDQHQLTRREIIVSTPSTTAMPIEYRISPVLLKGWTHLLIQFVDLSDSKKSEQQLLLTNETLEQTNAAAFAAQLASLNLAEDAMAARERSDNLNRTLQNEINARELLDAELRTSQSLLRSIIDSTPGHVFAVDLQHRFTLANALLAQDFGLTTESLIGKTAHDIFPADLATQLLATNRQILADGVPVTLEETIPDENGQIARVMSALKFPLRDAHGHVIGLAGVVTDITERRRIEKILLASQRESHNLRAALDEHAIVDITDTRGRITFVNDKFCAISQYSREELLGQDHRIISSGRHTKAFIQDLWTTIKSGHAWHGEFNNRAKDGSYYWVDTTIMPSLDEHGAVHEFVAIRRDITDRKLAEQVQQTLLKDKVALLKEVHHRVKNNLQVITSLLRLEAGRSDVSETKSVLALMQGRIHAMAQLHETLYRSGTFASINLGAYLGTLSTQIFSAHLLRHDLVTLTLDMGAVQVNMDQATSCGLLLNELVTNCLKHAFPDDRTGEVSISLQPLKADNQADGKLWRLRVRDTGVGLPGNFEEKRQTSLGLQLVDDLSQQVGGTLIIDSELGKGTLFTVDFKALVPAALVMP